MGISVALATHDGERYLPAQLRSIARQTQLPQELVLCDDASSDATVQLAERFAREAPFPVRVLRNATRVGPHETFFKAASACRGNAVALCDQDDIWLERKLERCTEALSGDGVMLVVHSASVVRHDLRPTGRRFPRLRGDVVTDRGAGDPGFTYPGFAMVFCGSVLTWGDWAGRPPSRHWRGAMTHDEWIALLASAVGRTAFLGEPLALYRQHSAQLFGVARRGPRETAARLRGYPPEAHEQVAECHEQHARYLRSMIGGANGAAAELTAALEHAAALRESTALAWRARAALYAPGGGRSDRVARLRRLHRDGAYGDRAAGGLGRRALLQDALVALAR